MISTSLLVGVRETRILGQNWLLAALLANYRSAERFYKVQQNRRYVARDEIPFYVNDRLLSEHYPTKESDLTAREILLGEGHELIASIPLILFSLLNCDAIRPATRTFRPSFDARIAAAASMSIMNPAVLARAIAPRVELWSEDGKEQRIESLRMNRVSLEEALDEEEEENGGLPILLLDSPWQIMLYRHVDDDKNTEIMDNTILNVVEKAVASYRVPPPVRFSLRQQDYLKQGETISSWERFSDAMLEDLDGEVDADTSNEMVNAFELWCTKIANTVYE